MQIFFSLLFKLLPLYTLILLGFFASRFFQVKKESIASLLINFIVPITQFTNMVTTDITVSTLSLPVLFFLICTSISLSALYFSKFIWKDSTRNMFAFTAASANTGYFGLPVAIAVFGNNPNISKIVLLALMGTALYTNSLGYFIAAKGQHTAKECLIKVLKLPLLYAFFLGLAVHLLGIHLGKLYFDMADNFTGAFVVIGMMLIGMGLADIRDFKFDLKFIGLSLVAKFFVWPAIMLVVLFVDSHMFHLYNKNIYPLLLLLTIIPLATNTVSYASILKSHPEKVSLAVLASTIFALFYIPIAAVYFLK